MNKTPVWTTGYKPTKKDLKGLYNYRYETAGDLVLDCYLSYEAEERETQDEPGTPAVMELIYALVEGVDISVMLGDWAETIEDAALGDLADQIEDAAFDRGEE
jgi:hypothetical protein